MLKQTQTSTKDNNTGAITAPLLKDNVTAAPQATPLKIKSTKDKSGDDAQEVSVGEFEPQTQLTTDTDATGLVSGYIQTLIQGMRTVCYENADSTDSYEGYIFNAAKVRDVNPAQKEPEPWYNPKKFKTWQASDRNASITMYDAPESRIKNQEDWDEQGMYYLKSLTGTDFFTCWAITWDTQSNKVHQYHNYIDWSARFDTKFQWESTYSTITPQPASDGGIKISNSGSGKGANNPQLSGGPPNRDWKWSYE